MTVTVWLRNVSCRLRPLSTSFQCGAIVKGGYETIGCGALLKEICHWAQEWEPTNLDFGALRERPTNQTTYTGWSTVTGAYVADGQLDPYLGPEQPEWGISQNLLPVCGIHSANSALVGEKAPGSAETRCAKSRDTREGVDGGGWGINSEEKRREDEGRKCGTKDPEEGQRMWYKVNKNKYNN